MYDKCFMYAGLQLRVCNEKLIFLFLNQNICTPKNRLIKNMLKQMGKKILTILHSFFFL